jgi:DMSO/TMAO reductase YedYZ heme-binding membrane subunit
VSAKRDSFGGGQLVGFAVLGLLAMSAAVIGNAGSGEPGLRMLVRASARSSLLLFGAAYAASSLRRLWKTPFSGWLLRQRRYLGLSFAASHALHLAAIFGLALVLGDAFTVDVPTLVGGGGAYVMIALMAATSSDRAFGRLGARRWRLLHRIGMHWIWIIFAVSYLPRAAIESPLYALPAAFVLALPAVRAAAWLRARRARSEPAAS